MKGIAPIILTILLLPLSLLAQKEPCDLSNTDAFFVHQVQEGETLFSISKQYEIDIKRIKKLNRIHPDSNTISIADVLVIPVTPLPEHQDDTQQKITSHRHQVKEGQTLFSIARMYKNVDVDSIKKWNELKSDTLDVGQELLLKSSEKASSVPNVDNQSPKNQNSDKMTNNPEENSQKSKKKDNFIFKGNKKERNNKRSDTATTIDSDTAKSSLPFQEFKNIYVDYKEKDMAKQSERGVATWLDKSYARGDANYYALHKYAPVGSVVEVRNLMNDRKVYVKVIGRLSNTESNQNVLVKITEASADYLNVLDEKFLVEVSTYTEGGITNQ